MTDDELDEELSELEALEKAATAAPWRVSPDQSGWYVSPIEAVLPSGPEGTIGCCAEEADANARLIPAARNALPKLMAALRAERERGKAMRYRFDEWLTRQNGNMFWTRDKRDAARAAWDAALAQPAAVTTTTPSDTECWQCPKCNRWQSTAWSRCRSEHDTGIPCDGRRAAQSAAGGGEQGAT